MDAARAKKLTEALYVGAEDLSEIARAASRNKKSLVGAGPYAERFDRAIIKLVTVEKEIMPIIQTMAEFDPVLLRRCLATVKQTVGDVRTRDAARKQIRMICQTEVLPRLGSLTTPVQPTSEAVLSAAVLAGAPKYLQRTLLQANGCYENRWYEASSVMIRKLVENLIIAVYEKHHKEAEIKKDGNFMMLNGLVTSILAQTHWSLGRETKRSLPEIKALGDAAAHNRHYLATQPDIDKVLPGLRLAVDDLLHWAGYK